MSDAAKSEKLKTEASVSDGFLYIYDFNDLLRTGQFSLPKRQLRRRYLAVLVCNRC